MWYWLINRPDSCYTVTLFGRYVHRLSRISYRSVHCHKDSLHIRYPYLQLCHRPSEKYVKRGNVSVMTVDINLILTCMHSLYFCTLLVVYIEGLQVSPYYLILLSYFSCITTHLGTFQVYIPWGTLFGWAELLLFLGICRGSFHINSRSFVALCMPHLRSDIFMWCFFIDLS